MTDQTTETEIVPEHSGIQLYLYVRTEKGKYFQTVRSFGFEDVGFVPASRLAAAEARIAELLYQLEVAQRSLGVDRSTLSSQLAEANARLGAAERESAHTREAEKRWAFLATELAAAIKDHGDCDGCEEILGAIKKLNGDQRQPVVSDTSGHDVTIEHECRSDDGVTCAVCQRDMSPGSDWATEEVTSGEPGSFGCDPKDSAALLRLREAIDSSLPWPSREKQEAGDYESAVTYSKGLMDAGALALTELHAQRDESDRKLTTAEAELVELKAERHRLLDLAAQWADVANWLLTCKWHLPSFVHRRIDNLRKYIGDASNPVTEPTSKAEPIVFERDCVNCRLMVTYETYEGDFEGYATTDERAATPADLAAAGYVLKHEQCEHDYPLISALATANASIRDAEERNALLSVKLNAVVSQFAEANAKLEAEWGLTCAACGANWMKDAQVDKASDIVEPYRKRAVEAEGKLEAAERELAHCREAAELLRLCLKEPSNLHSDRTSKWYYCDQRRPVASGTEEPPLSCYECGKPYPCAEHWTGTSKEFGRAVADRISRPMVAVVTDTLRRAVALHESKAAEPGATACDNCGGPLPDPGQVYALMLPWADGKHFCRKGCASDWQDKNRPAEPEATAVVDEQRPGRWGEVVKPDQCNWISGYGNRCGLPIGHEGNHRASTTFDLSPAVINSAEAQRVVGEFTQERLAQLEAEDPRGKLASQDPMLSAVTVGMLLEWLSVCGFSREQQAQLERIAKGGGKP